MPLSFTIGRSDEPGQPAAKERSMSDAIKPIGMPKWGLAMTEGKVNAWLVEEGAEVSMGQEILEIETSKITNVFESPVSGILRRKAAQEGETLPVGALLGVVADPAVSDAEIDAYVEEARAALAAAAAAPPPPEPQLVQAEGWTPRVLRMGPEDSDAIPLLLIHGFGGDLLLWQFNQSELAADRPVYAIDMPGHGGSTKAVGKGDAAAIAAAMRSALAALGVGRVHLAGHSLGGTVAMQMAFDEPDRVVSVTLVNSAGLGPEINAGYIDRFIRADKRKDMKAALEELFVDASIVSRDMVEDVLKFKRLDGALDCLRTIAGAVFPDGKQAAVFADRIAASKVPMQAVAGAQDRIVPPVHANAVPEARRHVLDGAGHMVPIEKPAELNRLIGEFVAFTSG
jgi:pyruvate dehydrogenase E2 component (dihydrolipoamide acetyltransferase)